MTIPTTAAGRALDEELGIRGRPAILAIEAEAAAPVQQLLGEVETHRNALIAERYEYRTALAALVAAWDAPKRQPHWDIGVQDALAAVRRLIEP